MTCPYCGFENEPASGVCVKCANPLSGKEPEAQASSSVRWSPPPEEPIPPPPPGPSPLRKLLYGLLVLIGLGVVFGLSLVFFTLVKDVFQEPEAAKTQASPTPTPQADEDILAAGYELPATAYQHFGEVAKRAVERDPGAYLAYVTNKKIEGGESPDEGGKSSYWAYYFYNPNSGALFALILDRLGNLRLNDRVILAGFAPYGDLRLKARELDSDTAYQVALDNGARERGERFKTKEIIYTYSHNFREKPGDAPSATWHLRFDYELDGQTGQQPTHLEFWIDPMTAEVLDYRYGGPANDQDSSQE